MGIYLNGIHISRKLSTEKGNYAQRLAAWRRLPNRRFKVRRMFMAAFAKPLLCAGRIISAKFNLKMK